MVTVSVRRPERAGGSRGLTSSELLPTPLSPMMTCTCHRPVNRKLTSVLVGEPATHNLKRRDLALLVRGGRHRPSWKSRRPSLRTEPKIELIESSKIQLDGKIRGGPFLKR